MKEDDQGSLFTMHVAVGKATLSTVYPMAYLPEMTLLNTVIPYEDYSKKNYSE